MSSTDEAAGRDRTLSRRSVTAGLLLAVVAGAAGCSGLGYEAECAEEGHTEGSPGMARCVENKYAAAKRARRRARYHRAPKNQGSGG